MGATANKNYYIQLYLLNVHWMAIAEDNADHKTIQNWGLDFMKIFRIVTLSSDQVFWAAF